MWLFFVYFPFVCLSFLGFSSESLPGDDVFCRLLSRPLPSVCFPCSFGFPSIVFVPVLFCFGSVYLLATAGFVTDQLMRDKQQQRVRFCFVLFFAVLVCFFPAI